MDKKKEETKTAKALRIAGFTIGAAIAAYAAPYCVYEFGFVQGDIGAAVGTAGGCVFAGVLMIKESMQ